MIARAALQQRASEWGLTEEVVEKDYVLEGGPLEPDDLLPVLMEMLDDVEQASGIALIDRPPLVRMRPGSRSAEGRVYYRGPRGAPAPLVAGLCDAGVLVRGTWSSTGESVPT